MSLIRRAIGTIFPKSTAIKCQAFNRCPNAVLCKEKGKCITLTSSHYKARPPFTQSNRDQKLSKTQNLTPEKVTTPTSKHVTNSTHNSWNEFWFWMWLFEL